MAPGPAQPIYRRRGPSSQRPNFVRVLPPCGKISTPANPTPDDFGPARKAGRTLAKDHVPANFAPAFQRCRHNTNPYSNAFPLRSGAFTMQQSRQPPLNPKAGTPAATIGMRPATPLRTKAKSVETTPSGCRTSWVLLRAQALPASQPLCRCSLKKKCERASTEWLGR